MYTFLYFIIKVGSSILHANNDIVVLYTTIKNPQIIVVNNINNNKNE